MHDLDRTLNEFEAGFRDEFEWMPEYGELNEQEEEMLAAELLGVSNEQELEQFLGGLLSRAAGAVKSFAGSAAGQALGGILKDAAGKALPVVGGAVGNWIGGSTGQKLGQQAGQWAKGRLGLEMESDHEMEFETAKALVRTAHTAARTLAQAPAPRGVNPTAVVKQAVIKAAQQQAPQLVRVLAAAQPVPAVSTALVAVGGQQGTWMRRGSTIVLYGV